MQTSFRAPRLLIGTCRRQGHVTAFVVLLIAALAIFSRNFPGATTQWGMSEFSQKAQLSGDERGRSGRQERAHYKRRREQFRLITGITPDRPDQTKSKSGTVQAGGYQKPNGSFSSFSFHAPQRYSAPSVKRPGLRLPRSQGPPRT